ncbi:uncharacterized protein LOC123312373 [Coccinella septempunctata]|uniref:uncharacterized protein LOC123312373 n=1 Tax=Coccinella septempunctata TaxID=41139 RepID=UPI001D0675BE|nr:uncharacterized protein LOC123312373 [Coccinella septempunctata]
MSMELPCDMKAISYRFDLEYSPDFINVKEYSPKSYDEKRPLGRTIFVAKIPLYLDENAVKKLFSEVGPVVSVNLHREKTSDDDEENMDAYVLGYQCAYIVYKTRESLLKVLNLDVFKTLTDDKFSPLKGLVEEYYDSIRNRYVVTETAQTFHKQKEDKVSKENNNVDEDGWTVVASKSKHSKMNPKLNDKLIYKKKKKLNKNFYTFQIKESKMKNLAALMEGYEEAKRKVAKMKRNRLFKPL